MTQTAKQVALIEYAKEISPMIRTLMKKKELQKDFKESSDGYLRLLEVVKEAQEDCKDYLAKDDDYAETEEEVKALTKELKLAVKAASENTAYKPADLLAYFVARNKEEGVVKVISKGELFDELEKELA